MQDSEEKSSMELDYKGLEVMLYNALSVFTSIKVNSAILSAKDNLASSCAKAEHVQQSLKESIRGMVSLYIYLHSQFLTLFPLIFFPISL